MMADQGFIPVDMKNVSALNINTKELNGLIGIII